MSPSEKPRLLIVSNRLPVNLVREDGKIVARESVGGLATGIGSYLDGLGPEADFDDCLWIGWPGMFLDPRESVAFPSRIMGRFALEAVNVPEADMDAFYHGFCNATLWPLFHYFTTYTEYDPATWESYKRVNALFCEAVARAARPGDVIWVHDYQLMLLPGMLRTVLPQAAIGFFLHIPFPSSEVFRTLSMAWRAEILEGLMGADLIGFHTYGYAQHFLNSLSGILGLGHNLGMLGADERLVKVDAFPMGIDFQKYAEAAASPEVQEKKAALRRSLGEVRLILSIDRLDYSKGIVNRLLGYEAFLEEHPEWRGKTALMLVVVPSRTGVERYQVMKKRIDELVGAVNGKYGALSWTPILYQYASFGLTDLAMLYDVSDVALITPLRDGMNLVAKEYVAAKTDGDGVLILSEMAGAAAEMGEALIISPYTPEEIARALKTALETEKSERVRVMGLLKERLRRFDVGHWAEDFLGTLLEVKAEQGRLESRFLAPETAGRVVDAFSGASRRLVILDHENADAAPESELLKALTALAATPGVTAAVCSGASRDRLERWFGGPPLRLAAENGAFIRDAAGQWAMPAPLSGEWKEAVRPILERFSSRLPGAAIEEQECSLIWRFSRCDRKLREIRSRELVETLRRLTANVDVRIESDDRTVEVRSAGANMAATGLRLTAEDDYDFILAMGGVEADEELFRALPPQAMAIRIGPGASHAAYNVRNMRAAVVLLANLVPKETA